VEYRKSKKREGSDDSEIKDLCSDMAVRITLSYFNAKGHRFPEQSKA